MNTLRYFAGFVIAAAIATVLLPADQGAWWRAILRELISKVRNDRFVV